MSKLVMLYHFKETIDEAVRPLFDSRTAQKDAYVCLHGDVDGNCRAIIKEYIEEIGLKVDSWSTDREYDNWTQKNEPVRVHVEISNPKKENIISLAEAEKLLGKTIIVDN